MRPLIIGPEEMSQIEAAITRARQNVVPAETFKQAAISVPQDYPRIQLKDRKPGYFRPPAEAVVLPFGYQVAFSFEQQPLGLCRHLSVSIERTGRSPNPHAVQMIAEAFGMHFPSGRMWLEEFEPDHWAVNLVELDQ